MNQIPKLIRSIIQFTTTAVDKAGLCSHLGLRQDGFTIYVTFYFVNKTEYLRRQIFDNRTLYKFSY